MLTQVSAQVHKVMRPWRTLPWSPSMRRKLGSCPELQQSARRTSPTAFITVASGEMVMNPMAGTTLLGHQKGKEAIIMMEKSGAKTPKAMWNKAAKRRAEGVPRKRRRGT